DGVGQVVDCVHDLIDEACFGGNRRRGDLAPEMKRIEAKPGQRVLDLVSHLSGHAAQGRDSLIRGQPFLHLLQLLFAAPAGGEVFDDSQIPDDGVLGPANHGGRYDSKERRAIGPVEPAFSAMMPGVNSLVSPALRSVRVPAPLYEKVAGALT